MPQIKVLIADDHAIVRMGLASLLGTRPEYEVVGDAGNGETALRKAARLKPDVILLDMVMPGMVYISHPTELGTVYTKEELTAIRKACDEYSLTLFLDGARLVYGLAASDVTLADLAALCDVFYLGGTKAGPLFGEAVVISQEALKRDFRYQIKQHGGMLAKGRLLGVQFEALLEDGLFQEIGQKAVAQAMRLQKAFLDKGYPMLIPSNTNQQFPILPNEVLDKLNEKYSNCLQCKIDADHTCVRFCTGWSTKDEDLDALIADIATC